MFKNLFKGRNSKKEEKEKEKEKKEEENKKNESVKKEGNEKKDDNIELKSVKENNLADSSEAEESADMSNPLEVKHAVHLDNKLGWSFDPSVDPKKVFTKLKVLGKGGFGTVLQIVHRPTMKVLAGKLINPNLVDENTKAEIQHEIELMIAVDSDYTVHYYGSVMFEGSLMILMEYCDRGSLRDLLDAREQVLSEDQISIVLHDILMGLHLIHHRHRIVHRDIKAANILITTDSEIKIADFGVSRQFDSENAQTMTITGTPYWMAPEVIKGSYYSFPADIWSLGITAVEFAEGAPPYVEYPPTKAMVEIAIKGFPGYRFPQMHSPEFTDFVSKCVIVDQSQRWTTGQLLEHPFIKRSERLPRAQVLRELLVPTKAKKKDTMDYSTLTKTNNSNITEQLHTIQQQIQQQTDSFLSSIQISNGNYGGFSDSTFVAGNADLPTGTDMPLLDGNTFSRMSMLMSMKLNPGSDGDSLASLNMPMGLGVGRNPFDSLSVVKFDSQNGECPSISYYGGSNQPLNSFQSTGTFVATNSPLEGNSTFVASNSPLEANSTFVASQSPLEATSTFVAANSPLEANSTFVAAQSPLEANSTFVATTSPLEGNSTFVAVQSPLEANSTFVSTQSPLEANSTFVAAQSPLEANSTFVAAQSPLEANSTFVASQSPLEANSTFVAAQSPLEANSTFVASQSPLEANSTFVAAQSPLESNSTFVASESPLGTADSTFVASESPLASQAGAASSSASSTKSIYTPQSEMPPMQQQSLSPDEVSDLVFVKVSRALSLKIPFVSNKVGQAPEVDIETLYKTEKQDVAKLEEPLFDEEGVLNIHRALREKHSPPMLATVLIILTFLSFGRGGFVVLVTLSLMVNLLVRYYRKRRRYILAHIDEDSDGPIN